MGNTRFNSNLTRGGAEAWKEEETWRGSYTQKLSEKESPNFSLILPDKDTTIPTSHFIKA